MVKVALYQYERASSISGECGKIKWSCARNGRFCGASKISCAIDLRTTIRYEVGMTDARNSGGGLATGE